MVRRRDAGFRLATFWIALSSTNSIGVMVSPPGTPGGVPEGRGTVTGQGAFLAPPAICVVMSFSAVRDRCNQH